MPGASGAVGSTGPAWLTASVRPAGSFGRADVVRLRALLGALSATASLVVLDLAAVSLRSHQAADVIDEAGWELERRGGCLLCINADDDVRAQLGGCTARGRRRPGRAVARTLSMRDVRTTERPGDRMCDLRAEHAQRPHDRRPGDRMCGRRGVGR